MPSLRATILGPCRWVLARPPLLLLLLCLLFFSDLVLHPTRVLYSDTSDLLALHLPDKQFLVRSWHETGELPLWCPYRFAGMPFLHDIQTSIFYPLHWPLLLLPEETIGPALSWLVMLHVLIAGWGMYAYARFRALDKVPALVAAIGYQFAGKWLLHVLAAGHYNMLMLAWLPVGLLFLERANRSRRSARLLFACGAGVVFSFFVLAAYPYVTLHAGLFLALWTLGTALEQSGYLGGDGPRSWQRTLGALARWAGMGVVTALVGVGLGAVQLLPGLELAGLATRGAGLANSHTWGEGFVSLISLIGPTVSTLPTNLTWELRGGFGLLWLGLALLAPVLVRGRVRFETAIAALFFFLAFGGTGLLSGLPGFDLFRLPSRIFLVASFPVAYLAGVTTQALLLDPHPSLALLTRCRRLFLGICVLLLAFVGLFAAVAAIRGTLRVEWYWATLVVSLPLLLWLFRDRPGLAPGTRQTIWVALLLIDLWALSHAHVAVRPEKQVFAASESVHYLTEHRDPPQRVLDHCIAEDGFNSPLGSGAPLALIYGLESLRGFNPMDVRRYKEYVQFVTDRDEPLRPLEHPLTGPVIGDFPVRNRALLDLLGVRYVVQKSSDQPAPGWRKVAQDEHPQGFDALAAGMEALPAYTVYENPDALPRAFVVGEAVPMPERAQVLATLRTTPFRQRVLLEGLQPGEAQSSSPNTFCPAEVVNYHPNRVTLQVPPGPGGYLVLTDVWFPGWRCTVDGQPVGIARANYLFRAVPVEAGTHEVVFTFEPESYRVGRLISLATLGLLAGLSLMTGIGYRLRARRAPSPLTASTPEAGSAGRPMLPGHRLPPPASPAPLS